MTVTAQQPHIDFVPDLSGWEVLSDEAMTKIERSIAPPASAGTECTCVNAYTSSVCPIHGAGTEGPGLRDVIGDVLRKHNVPFATVIADDVVTALARVEGEKK